MVGTCQRERPDALDVSRPSTFRTVKEHEAVGDVDADYEPTTRQVRVQRERESLAEHIKRMHFHEITAGEGVGCFTSHTHDDDALGHPHSPRHVYPGRADGGYMEELGPSLGHETPPSVAANARIPGA